MGEQTASPGRARPEWLPRGQAPLLGEPAVREAVGPLPTRKRGTPILRRLGGVHYLLPALLVVVVVLVLPTVVTAGLSLTREVCDQGAGPEASCPAGASHRELTLANYRRINWNDSPDTIHALFNTALWVFVSAAVVVVLGITLAVLVRRAGARQALALVIAAPMTVSALVTGVAFRLIADPAEERTTLTWVSERIRDALVDDDDRPAAGAVPWRSQELTWNEEGLITKDTYGGGEAAVIALTGLERPPAGAASKAASKAVSKAKAPPGDPNAIVGMVEYRPDRAHGSGVPLPGVPVELVQLGEVYGKTKTGPDGRFGFVLERGDRTRYWLRIPADAVRSWQPPRWLGPDWVRTVLVAAFLWGWVGFAVLLFRQALDAVPPQLYEVLRMEGASRVQMVRRLVLPLLRPARAIVLTSVIVAGLRVFDLVLVLAPGSVQEEASTIAVHAWRELSGGVPEEASAVAVLLLVLVLACMAYPLRWLRQEWRLSDAVVFPPPTAEDPGTEANARRSGLRRFLPARLRPGDSGGGPDVPARRQPLSGGGRYGAVTRRGRWPWLPWLMAAVWLLPLAVVVATSLHDARAAATAGWLSPEGLGLDSYGEFFKDPEVQWAIVRTAVLSLGAAGGVLALAAPAAYALVWFELPGSRAVVWLLVGLAVLPIQVVSWPLNTALTHIGLAGRLSTLAAVHVAFGLPIAVLLLRPAFAAVPPELVRRMRTGEDTRWQVFRTVVLPRCRSTVWAVGVLEFVQVWNDVVVALTFGGNGARPLGLLLFEQTRQFTITAGVLSAGAAVSALVPLLVIVATRRHLMDGLVSRVAR